jgi:hypothetical protein
MRTIHVFSDSGEAYDDSQTGYFLEDDPRPRPEVPRNPDGSIPSYDEAFDAWVTYTKAIDELLITVKDGDILYVPGTNTLAVMVQAWPCAIIGPPGEFHEIEKGQTIQTHVQAIADLYTTARTLGINP